MWYAFFVVGIGCRFRAAPNFPPAAGKFHSGPTVIGIHMGAPNKSKFVSPADFAGVIPGRGRKPSALSQKISGVLKGCPVEMGILLEISEAKQATAKGRARIRGAIKTGAERAGWSGISVSWTDTDQPFVLRTA